MPNSRTRAVFSTAANPTDTLYTLRSLPNSLPDDNDFEMSVCAASSVLHSMLSCSPHFSRIFGFFCAYIRVSSRRIACAAVCFPNDGRRIDMRGRTVVVYSMARILSTNPHTVRLAADRQSPEGRVPRVSCQCVARCGDFVKNSRQLNRMPRKPPHRKGKGAHWREKLSNPHVPSLTSLHCSPSAHRRRLAVSSWPIPKQLLARPHF